MRVCSHKDTVSVIDIAKNINTKHFQESLVNGSRSITNPIFIAGILLRTVNRQQSTDFYYFLASAGTCSSLRPSDRVMFTIVLIQTD